MAAPAPEQAADGSIAVRAVSKTYRTQREGVVEALRNIDLTIEKGEFVSIVGPSGCGKSTLLHLIAALVDHDAGTIEISGRPTRAGRQDVAIMLQRPALLAWRTILANVLLPGEIYKLDRRRVTERAKELLEMVGLGEFEDKYPWELSGGMRQRASLAQVLVADPQLVLMDEPFSGVDDFTRERLNVELARIHDELGRTTLLVTHNLSEAVFLSDRVITMRPRPGEVVDSIDIDLPRPRTRALLEDDELLSRYVHKVRQSLFHGEGAERDGR